MPKHKYQTSPPAITGMPSGIPYIVGNEAAERFSFYGMRTILFIFMTQYLVSSTGTGRAVMSPEDANFWFHLFVASAYFFPIMGAIASDVFLGKYNTILWLSIVYCLGHLALAMDETRLGLFTGLTLIAIGTGAIKPCVSAHVGDQFGSQNKHLISKVFGWFYFAINFGAFFSTLLTPILLSKFGPGWAFGVPGILMAIATIVFWMGRRKFIHVPARGLAAVREAFSGEGLRAIGNLAIVFVFVAMFWSLFDQTGSAWVHQAKRMDRAWDVPVWLNGMYVNLGLFDYTFTDQFEWLPSQIQAANPLLILVFIPLFSYVVYPAINRVFPLTPLRKVGIGFFVAVPAFALPAWIDMQITGGEVISATSEASVEEWPVERLFDGKRDKTGWVSSELEPDKPVKQEIILRLRERRAWTLSSIDFTAGTDATGFLETAAKTAARHATDEAQLKGLDETVEPKSVTRADIENCWPKDVEVFVAETRLGDSDGVEDGKKRWNWKRSVGSIQLRKSTETQRLEFGADDVQTEYLMIRITSNWGGKFVALSEIAVNSDVASPPTDAHEHAADVWPNVAATGYRPGIVWQLWAYVLMTAAEIMISITCLEFAYTQAPNKMKSFIMSLYLLSVTLGNLFTAAVNYFIQNEDKSSKLDGSAYYWFFTAAIFLAGLGFIVAAKLYRGRTYIQGESESDLDTPNETSDGAEPNV